MYDDPFNGWGVGNMEKKEKRTFGTVKLVAMIILFFMLVFTIGRILVVGQVQRMVIYSTPGMPYASTESILGAPIYEYTLEEWQKAHPELVSQLPGGIKRVVKYGFLSNTVTCM